VYETTLVVLSIMWLVIGFCSLMYYYCCLLMMQIETLSIVMVVPESGDDMY
jgi:hypothetical protein